MWFHWEYYQSVLDTVTNSCSIQFVQSIYVRKVDELLNRTKHILKDLFLHLMFKCTLTSLVWKFVFHKHLNPTCFKDFLFQLSEFLVGTYSRVCQTRLQNFVQALWKFTKLIPVSVTQKGSHILQLLVDIWQTLLTSLHLQCTYMNGGLLAVCFISVVLICYNNPLVTWVPGSLGLNPSQMIP